MKKLVFGICLLAPAMFACGPVGGGGSGGRGGAGGAGGAGGTGAGAQPGNNPFCAAKQVITAKCTSCHSNPPNSNAPFSLVTYQDVAPRAARIQARINQAVGQMPPANAPQLSADEKAAINNWVAGGAQGSDSCGGTGTGTCTGGTPTCQQDPSYCVGEQFLDCTPTVRLRAHAPGNLNAPYNVRGGTTDAYNCFRFRNPFYGTNMLMTREAPIIGNPAVIHHWLLFGSMGGIDGSVDESGVCVSPELTDTLLAGWAPGGTNAIFPDDVGVKMSNWPFLTLQMHYNNPSFAAGGDQSGVAFCTTNQPKPNVAGIVTLGTDLLINIPGGARNHPGGVSSCSNMFRGFASGTATIVGSSAHMHKLGSGFTTEHLRGGQRQRYVTNVPLGTWKFDGQIHYPHHEKSSCSAGRIQVQPGDVLNTTCYYTNPGFLPVGFGTGTTAEMCYDFLMAYPIDQLRRGCGPIITFNQ